MAELWRRIEAWLRHRSLDRDLEEELRFHLDMKARETGDPPPRGVRWAARFCSREHARDAWGWRWLDAVLWDVRYALRQFRQNPGFTAIAVTMLALGIGVNAAVFTLTNGILFRGTPHIDPTNRIVYLQTSRGVSYPDFQDWREQARSFDGQMAVVFIGGNRSSSRRPARAERDVRRDPTECECLSRAGSETDPRTGFRRRRTRCPAPLR